MHNFTRRFCFLALIALNFITPKINAIGAEEVNWEDMVGSKMNPPTETIYCVNDYGLPQKHELIANTKAIQKAIDECSLKGGGIVMFKPGIYLTGALFLKDNVNLRIDEGVELWAVQDIEFYPEVAGRIAGIEMDWPAAMINVIGKKNVAISGKGIINAQGKFFWEKYWNMRVEYEKKKLRWIVDYDCKRVRTILVSKSEHVTVRDITMKQSGFWSVHILYSNNITVDGVTIRNNIDGSGPSTDGIDIDSSTKILVENCDVDCNDDNYCLKAGRDADGLRVNKPTEYVVIRNCISRVGAGLITIGSETSGSIRNIHAYNLKAYGTSAGIKFKSALTRGGVVENIHIHDVELNNVGTAISVGLNWNPSYSYSSLPEGYNENTLPAHWEVMLQKVTPKEKGIPKFQNIIIENLTAKNSNIGIIANGVNNSQLDSFHLKNINIQCKKPGNLSYARDWIIDNVKINDGEKLDIKNSSKVQFLSSN